MTDNKTPCRWCGTICNHDDDAHDECRFCHTSARNPDGSPKTESGIVACGAGCLDGEFCQDGC